MVFSQKVPGRTLGAAGQDTTEDVLCSGKASYFVLWVSTQHTAAVTQLLPTHPPKITLLVPNIMAPTPPVLQQPWGT